MNILFRVDSSSSIGIGHLMRDFVLAQQFDKENIYFACQELEGNLNKSILKKGYSLEILKSNRVDELISLIKKLDILFLVIDHYGINKEYEEKIKKETKTKLLVFDDTYEEHYCDILLNHNICAKKDKYVGLLPSFTELRCGKEFTLIRDEFVEEKKQKKIKKFDINKIDVLIAMGGADHSNVNIDILKSLNKFSNIFVKIVTTTANKNINKLESFVKSIERTTLHINSDKMANFINNSDFVIISPSVVAHEVLFLEIPFIAIKTAKNQDDMYSYLHSNSLFVLDSFNKHELEEKIDSMIASLKGI